MLRPMATTPERDPETMPPGMLAHADQLQAGQAEDAAAVDEMFADLEAGQKTWRPPTIPADVWES